MKKRFCLLLVLAMLCALMAGCGSTATEAQTSTEAVSAPAEEPATEETAVEAPAPAEETAVEEPAPAEGPAGEPAAEAPAPAEEPAAEAPAEETAVTGSDLEIVRTYTAAETFPLTEDKVVLTAWDYVVPPVMAAISDYGTDGQVYAELQKRSGITLEFTTANLLTASEGMSLMIAANNLPDIIFDFGMFNSTSMDDLVGDEMIVNLCDYEDVMPNYFDILRNNKDIARSLYTEAGYIGYAANIQETLIPSSGPCIRKDWLDADGLEIPVTVDELHEVLVAFQEQNGCEYPFWIAANGSSSLNSAYGISLSGSSDSLAGWLYQDGEEIFCLPMEGFRDYIQLMADWYAEGLIDPDFVVHTMNGTATTDEIINGASGFFSSSVNGMTDLKAYDPESDLVPMRRVVLQEGDTNSFDDAGTNRVSKGGASVACTNPEVELSVRLLDYGYSDDGILLWNYGVEGVSFEYTEEGEPQLTELVTNNPDLDFTAALIKYTCSTPASICINSRNYIGYTDEQIDALTLWLRTAPSEEAPGSLWSADAQTEYSNISSDMESFVATRCLEFIIGARPMSEWDSFVEEVLTSFDIDRLKELSEEAVARYIALYPDD